MSNFIFESVEQLVSPEGLGALTGSVIESVERAPLAVEHFSGNTLERVTAKRENKTMRFVLKHFSFDNDWIMRHTQDYEVREVALFRFGIFPKIPEWCIVPIIAVARNGKSWSSLMVDVSEALTPSSSEPIPLDDLKRYLNHLAVIHARFMEDESLLNPKLGLTTLRDFILILSPQTVSRSIEQGQTHRVLEWAQRGWQQFAAQSPDASRILEKIRYDLRPLLRAIARAPRTLVHGDYKLANLGTWIPPMPSNHDENAPHPAVEPRTIVLDWQGAAFGSPLLDLGYFLAINSSRLPVSKEETIQIYRDALALYGYRYQEHSWTRDLEVGLLAGGAMRLVWQHALSANSADETVRERATSEIAWWSEVIVRASRWLG
jgi:hypothetical protein